MPVERWLRGGGDSQERRNILKERHTCCLPELGLHMVREAELWTLEQGHPRVERSSPQNHSLCATVNTSKSVQKRVMYVSGGEAAPWPR